MKTLLRKSKRDNKEIEVLQHITKKNSDLEYTELKVLEMDKDKKYNEKLDDFEVCIVVLEGKVTITEGDNIFNKIGRRDSIFEKIPTDSVYIGKGKEFNIYANTPTKIALTYAPANKALKTKLIKAEENTIEHRGIKSNKRKVHNILPDTSSDADSLLVVEVFTDSGNFSSYPPHKHDKDNLPEESLLEEIYYHEINPPQGFVFQRVYTDDRSIDQTMSVYTEDAVIVPKGYHPVGVPDGYDSYYLNVMAGPQRVWKFKNENDHEWIIEDRK